MSQRSLLLGVCHLLDDDFAVLAELVNVQRDGRAANVHQHEAWRNIPIRMTSMNHQKAINWSATRARRAAAGIGGSQQSARR